MSKTLKIIFAYLFGVGFIMHLIWELPQCLLYPMRLLSPDHLFMLFLAALGDALAGVVIFAVGIRIFKDSLWLFHLNPHRSAYALGMGFLIGVTGETVALKLAWWSYGPLMPMIPIFNVGLSPVVQMTLLPYAGIVLVRWILNRKVDNEDFA